MKLPPTRTQALVTSFRGLIDAFAREVPQLDQGDVEALHRMRVASRRLRELVPLLALDPDKARRLNRRLRRVTRRLGEVRELDVLSLLVRELRSKGGYPEEALKLVDLAVQRARMSARERLARRLPATKLERLARRLERAMKRRAVGRTKAGPSARANRPKESWRWALDARVARRAEKTRTAIEAAGAVYLSEPVHDVRIALKKLRYAVELQTQATRGGDTGDIAAMKAGQDLLGRLHDVEVLISWTREAQASLFPPDLTTWKALASLVRALDDDCRLLHARYVRDRVKLSAIADRLRAAKTPAPHGHRAAS